ncbi:MAG: ABC transporter permease [Microlunatus sp.]|nr:ABC transporter permease [Microlunatus sp.]MDN5770181.1 ABC transporter permease [Microlunatus sp.]MDN5803287.1 ABC transporter permease [Microlunatus sp.]
MTATARVGHDDSEEFEPVYHRYGPHRAGLPPLVPYFRELWARREFAAEMSKATLRGANVTTFFGQAWLILNPLLLAGVYYLLVTIIRQRHDAGLFTHLTLALFAFTMLQTAASTGATSVTGSGRLLINTAFPRLLIPLSAVRTAFWRFLPTIPVYLIFHAVFGLPWHPRMMLSLYFLATIVVFAMGLAAFFATLQVYFRDTSSFLPYFLRLWLYLSPILWMPVMLDRMSRGLRVVVELNPMYPMLTGYSHLLQDGVFPPLWMWLAAAGWAIAAVVVGFLFFISREREFAVRLT